MPSIACDWIEWVALTSINLRICGWSEKLDSGKKKAAITHAQVPRQQISSVQKNGIIKCLLPDTRSQHDARWRSPLATIGLRNALCELEGLANNDHDCFILDWCAWLWDV